MKISKTETYDRQDHFLEDQKHIVAQGAEECLKKHPLSIRLQQESPYIYVYGHARTADDGVTKRILWQPRLTKPRPDSNSFLFRAISRTDILRICWILPPHETWKQFQRGSMFANNIIGWSIAQFKNHFEELAAPDPEDFTDEEAAKIYGLLKKNEKVKLV